MKKDLFSAVIVLMVLAACRTPNTPATTTGTTTSNTVQDSIEYYETDFEVRQRNYLHLLKGAWNLTIMKRQAMLEAETLTGVYLQFNPDSTFTGNAGCNQMSGRYSIKGTSIVFNSIITTKMACDRLEQETALLGLLQNTVSAYTVTEESLLLRDGASNIIFQAARRNP